jgi:hypothetical protein
MSGTYLQQAVDAVRNAYNSGFAAALDAIETEESLDPGTLVDPLEYLTYWAPHDNRSPLMQCYDVGFQVESQRSSLYVVRVGALLTYNGDADLDASERRMRRYVTAMVRAITADTTLGGAAIQAAFVGARQTRKEQGDSSASRYAYQIEWDVWVQDT